MTPAIVKDILGELLAGIGSAAPDRREAIRSWELSAVERIHLGEGTNHTVIFKVARPPLLGEAAVLAHVEHQGVPVPRPLAAVTHDDLLGMLLEDLGPAVRDATLAETGAAAVAAHRTSPPEGL